MGKGSAENAIRFASELQRLLELEFEALKSQKLSEIESIQQKKVPILEYLNADSIKANLKEVGGEADYLCNQLELHFLTHLLRKLFVYRLLLLLSMSFHQYAVHLQRT